MTSTFGRRNSPHHHAQREGSGISTYFTVDGTLIEAWASLKSFRRKGEKPEDRRPPDDRGNPSVDFRREKRSNATRESTTDLESKLATKCNQPTAKLSYSGHVLMENRNGLCVDIRMCRRAATPSATRRSR